MSWGWEDAVGLAGIGESRLYSSLNNKDNALKLSVTQIRATTWGPGVDTEVTGHGPGF